MLLGEAISWKDFSDFMMAVVGPVLALFGGLIRWMWVELKKMKKAHNDCVKDRTRISKERDEDRNTLQRMNARMNKYQEQVVKLDAQLRNTTVVQVDHDGNVMVWDAKATAMFGWTNGEMMGKSIGMLMPLQYRQEFMSELLEAATAKKYIKDHLVETEAQCKRGEEFLVRIRLNCWVAGGKWYGAGEFSRVVNSIVSDGNGVPSSDWTKADSDPFKTAGPPKPSTPP